MKNGSTFLTLMLSVVAGHFAGCGSNDSAPPADTVGTEGGPCRPGGDCNAWLTCVDNVCVPIGGGGSGGEVDASVGGAGGTGQTGGAGGSTGGAGGSTGGAGGSTGGAGGSTGGAGGSSAGGTGGTGGSSTGGASGSGGSSAGGAGGQADCGSPTAYFPVGSWIYQDISQAPVRANSSNITQWLRNNGGWGYGEMRIDFTIEVLQKTASTPYLEFTPTGDFYSPDCDQVPMPVPPGGALEGESGYECVHDGDCHLIVVDCDQSRLFEMWRANIVGNTFYGGCLAAWDMTRVYPPEGRGDQCTSADAGGFPIAPLIFSADEVAAGEIAHAIRFILPNGRMRQGVYTRPGTHAGAPSGPSSAPVYGGRWRLKSSFNLASLPNEAARTVARAMQKYGMVLADGGNVALTARSDRFTTAKWDGLLASDDLAAIEPTDFEVIDTGDNIQLTYDCVRTPY